jgi:hypothetical protein
MAKATIMIVAFGIVPLMMAHPAPAVNFRGAEL